MAKKQEVSSEQKFLDINADMQGKLTFKDPVNLKINGSFDGELITKGLLIIGPKAVITATIDGDEIEIGGHVRGQITASRRVQLTSTARVEGNLITPKIGIDEGAYFNGKCDMVSFSNDGFSSSSMTEAEVCTYLEVDSNTLRQWVSKGKIPAIERDNRWEFDRARLDKWIADTEIKK